MGLADRDYYGDEPRATKRKGRGLSAVATIILLNVAFFLINQGVGNVLFEKMMLLGGVVGEPLQWYRCLTYGFAHDPNGFAHILFNMLALFFFGIPLERIFGKAEFYCFYLLAVVFSGAVWNVLHSGENMGALGASGAITAVVIHYACLFPKQIVSLYGIIPIPMWLLGVAYVVYDAIGAQSGTSNIGHDVHLAGAAFAVFYFLSGVRFTRLFSFRSRREQTKSTSRNSEVRKKGFTLFNRDAKLDKMSREELEVEVDRILAKYTKYGKESLTKEEERTLYYASEAYQTRK